ncbi:hypothetical protein PG919_26725 [Klebsiella pneumoniae]|uniref:hypothetical protein n=1 Tax=Klebsiella pneumoniae TaxID=573 RepID=UPI0021506DDA|nr:hypothetical protein [Klebsiella pneumoniae]MDA5131679.1 hypothetical protein [Klebsiella pneumoniae]MDA5192010.1 hypothetical protein [Klebsiella pneumoniae]HCJ2819318.1 hypothetical protein [Klebsiella pneumoniae]
MFRLATPADYEYLPDLGLYELTFDKRPIKGVRCDDPAQGAAQYNEARAQFKSALRARPVKKKQRWAISPDLNFNEVIQWALKFGSPAQCQLILNLYHERQPDKFSHMAIELAATNSGEDDLLNFVLFLFDKRSACSVSLLCSLEENAAGKDPQP